MDNDLNGIIPNEWCRGTDGYAVNGVCAKGGIFDAPMDTPEKLKAVCCLSRQKKAKEEAAAGDATQERDVSLNKIVDDIEDIEGIFGML